MMTVTKILIKRVGIAGMCRQAQINIRAIGKSAHQLMVKCWVKTAVVRAILPASIWEPALPSSQKRISETTNEGMVDHIMFLMWAKRSLPAIADARLVESERGDILSPKTAPEMIAPAIRAGLMFIATPIPKRAIPIVEIVVKPLPIDRPTSEQTTNVEGIKN